MEWCGTCLVYTAQASQKSLTTQNAIACLPLSCYSTFFKVPWQACEMISEIVWDKIYIKSYACISEIAFIMVYGPLMLCFGVVKSFSYLKVHYCHHISLFFQKEKPLTSANVKLCGLALPSFLCVVTKHQLDLLSVKRHCILWWANGTFGCAIHQFLVLTTIVHIMTDI